MIRSGGSGANKSGQRLEDFVASILEEHDYRFIERDKFFPMQKMQQAIYTRQYETNIDIYGRKRTVDFILYHPALYQNCLVIQCKWQAVSGTVEQKYPFEVLNITQDGYDTIIILDGRGYSQGARQWLLNQAGKLHLKYVFDQSEFQRFASSGKL